MPNYTDQTGLSQDISEWDKQMQLADKALLEGDVEGFFKAQTKLSEIEQRQRERRKK